MPFRSEPHAGSVRLKFRCFAVTVLEGADSPPWPRRGGRDINKNAAKPPLLERTGWFVQLPINRRVERTTPSAPAKEASRYLISGAATPPWPRRGLSLAMRTCGNIEKVEPRPPELSVVIQLHSTDTSWRQNKMHML